MLLLMAATPEPRSNADSVAELVHPLTLSILARVVGCCYVVCRMQSHCPCDHGFDCDLRPVSVWCWRVDDAQTIGLEQTVGVRPRAHHNYPVADPVVLSQTDLLGSGGQTVSPQCQ